MMVSHTIALPMLDIPCIRDKKTIYLGFRFNDDRMIYGKRRKFIANFC